MLADVSWKFMVANLGYDTYNINAICKTLANELKCAVKSIQFILNS